MSRCTCVAALIVLLSSCIEVPTVPEESAPAEDGGSATADGGSSSDGGTAPSDTRNPTITITAPQNGAQFGASVSTVTVTGTTQDDVGVAGVQVFVGPNAPVAAASQDFYRTWSVTAPLPPGPWTIRARAFDDSGKTSDAQVTVTRASGADTTPPTLTILSPPDPTSTTNATVVVTGTASDDTGVAKVETRVDGLSQFTMADTSDTFANWRAAVGLGAATANTVRVRATDI